MPVRRALSSVLILADQPMIAALVGMLVELADWSPVFSHEGERPIDALRRTRPAAMVLVDVALDDARSDIFFAAATRLGVRMVVFGPPTRALDIAEVAGSRSIPWFLIPTDAEHLASTLALASGIPRERTRSDGRRSTDIVRTPDGASIFSDASGRRWMAYDRRGQVDRRDSERGQPVDRVFVSEDGVRVTCAAPSDRLDDLSVDALARQLERASETGA